MSTPGHYQRLEAVADVLTVHKAHGIVTGVLVVIQDGAEPLHIALMLDPPHQWPAGIDRGTRLWLRGRLGQEKEVAYKRNLHFILVEHWAVLRRRRVVS